MGYNQFMVNKRKNDFVCKQCNAVGGTSHDGFCITCYNKEYYKSNRSEIIKKSIDWAKDNPEKNRERKRISAKKRWAKLSKEKKLEIIRKQEAGRSESQKEKRRQQHREYYEKNKDVIKERLRSQLTFKAPCVVCGKSEKQVRQTKGKCRSCYRKEMWRKQNPTKEEKACIECGGSISGYSKMEKCKNCRTRERYANDSQYKEMINARNIINNKKDKVRAKKRIAVLRRRAKIANLEFDLTKQDWEEILSTFNHRCAYCGKSEKLEMDHVIPISKGGATTKENIVPACRSCNSKKGDKIGKFFPKVYESV